jgi:Flp pilus assembly protein TadG
MQTHTDKTLSITRGDSGQTFVEFALVLPFLALIIFGILQFGLLFRDYISITDAARVGARAAAVNRTTSPCGAATTAIEGAVSPDLGGKISIDCTAGPSGEQVEVEIAYTHHIGILEGLDFVGLKGISHDFDLKARARERME